MNLKPKARHYFQWLGATLAAVLTTVGLAMAGARATTAGMVFLVVVVVTASQAELVIALYSALLCAISFDYFFLPPLRTFTLAGPQEWISILTFAVSSVVAGRVSERARKQKEQAEQRREDVERLYLLSQEMMLNEDAAALIRDLPSMMGRIFSVGSVVLFVQERDQFVSTETELPEMFKANLREMTGGGNPAVAAQDGFEAHALMVGMRAVGAMAWKPSSLSREVATAVCAQVGIAITRAIAIEATARMWRLRARASDCARR